MARVAERGNRISEAAEHCNVALELDPHNAEAQDILDALQHGRPLPDGPTARLQPDAEGKRTLDSFVVFEDIEMVSSSLSTSQDQVSPADVTREKSLAQLAESLFTEDVDPEKMQANLLLGQGADFQTRGLVDRAIDAYISALRVGADSEAVYFNLGLLYLKKGDLERAIDHLSHSLSDPSFALGAHFAISETYSAWGRMEDALQHLLHVLVLVDSQTIPEDRVEEMEEAYEQLYREYTAQSDGRVQLAVESITDYLSRPGWTNQLLETRKHLDGLAGGDLLITLAEVISESEAEATMTALIQIREYLERKMLFTALEECFWAIQKSPYYLPLHLRIADLLISEGRLDEAVEKYVTVAETYKVRGELNRAIVTYRKALELTPMNIQVREKLTRLLLDARRIDQAMEQYMAAADAYYQLAQVGKAVETYNEALKYANMGDPNRHWEANVLHRIGDIYTQRVDWRQAIKAYQRIKHVIPEDVKARSYLVDLHFKLGQRAQALREMDELIELCKSAPQATEALATIQDIVRARPEELAVHMRAAKMYLDMGETPEAIAELDAVGEIQLQAGKTREAIRTIQAIIRLGPKDARSYQQLLAQLSRQT
jgi:tetratricopeptide (TPR) repeat protein